MIENDPIFFAVPLFYIFIAIELYISYKENLDNFEQKDSWASIAMGFGSAFTGTVMKFVFLAIFYFLYQYRLFDIGWQWWAWLLLFFADDFSFYWHHRMSHQVRILWAAHINHHSSQKYNLTTALRQSWTELFYKYCFWLWLPLLGFHPIMIMIMTSFSLIYQFFLHTELVRKLPAPIEFIFNTPSHHRVHHAVNIQYLDRNHGGVLIIWDRLFGTFIAEDEKDAPVYGITNNINTFNPFKIATHEFTNIWTDVQKTSTWRNKLRYLVMPPGWSHNGPNRTSKYLQEQAKKKEA